mmetsp:Transcript_36318/g.111928  ORF Transcript_36318/g.111928 Transcript_36318/m.111928 type:complete len:84 (-) Transcript_36318:744-995(-)
MRSDSIQNGVDIPDAGWIVAPVKLSKFCTLLLALSGPLRVILREKTVGNAEHVFVHFAADFPIDVFGEAPNSFLQRNSTTHGV